VSEDTQRYRAPALDKGLDILELLARQPNGLTRSEIVKELDRKPSEIYRMLDRLVERQYVLRSSLNGGYILSMKLFLLGSNYPPTKRLVDAAITDLNNFAYNTKQSIHMVIPERGKGLVVAQSSGEVTWEFRLPIGAKLGLKTSGSGLVLMAFQDEARVETLFSAASGVSDDTEILSEAMRQDLADIRNRGYRIGSSQQLVGVTDITVPVLGIDNNAVAVLTCPYIEYINQADDESPILDVQAVLAILQEVGKKLSYSSGTTEAEQA